MSEGSYLGGSWLQIVSLLVFVVGSLASARSLNSLLSPLCGAGLGVIVTVFLSESMLHSEFSLDLVSFTPSPSHSHPQPGPGCLHGSWEADQPELRGDTPVHSFEEGTSVGSLSFKGNAQA